MSAAMGGAGLFALAETRVATPLLPLAMLRERQLSAGLAVNGLVATVMMATLVVGPFHLTHGLGLDTAWAGLALSVGPVVSALAGLPAGRLVDRFGAPHMAGIGLAAIAAGAAALSLVPVRFGVTGYVLPIMLATAGYALFQAANNTAVMTNLGADRRGLVSGMLQLSRYLGLVTGASAMGTVFAFAVGGDIATAGSAAVAAGMRFTFAVAAGLIVLGLAIALLSLRARNDTAGR
jgi:MFS family permease